LFEFDARTIRGGGGGGRSRIAQRHPHIGVGLRLALDEAVAGVRPQDDILGLVIEHVVAAVGLDGEHGVAFVLLVAHHRDQQRFARPARLQQHAPFQKHVVLAVAVTVVRIGPLLDDAPMIEIGHRFDRVVDPGVDLHEVAPGPGGQDDIARRAGAARAFGRLLGAELDPADRGARLAGHRHIGEAVGRMRALHRQDGRGDQHRIAAGQHDRAPPGRKLGG
jgi:hypothetical protein